MRFILLCLYISLTFALQAQSSLKKEIDFYGDVMIYAFEENHRTDAAEKFNKAFESYIESTPYEQDDLNWLKWASILYPQDSTFRLITWQLKRTKANYDYYGFVQFKSGTIVKLSGGEEYWDKITYDERPHDDCPMAMYYNMKQLSDDRFLIFGVNELNAYEKVKLADVLTIRDEQITFGAPIFMQPEGDPKYRIVLQYSDDAIVSLNYNEDLNLLIYDHLINRMGRIPDQGVTSLPDGSYEGYKIKGDKLEYVEKVYDHIYEKAPRPMPKSDTNQAKDLFGKTKKKKGN